jgi:DNA (cytosine-5)-methyltransferase 1
VSERTAIPSLLYARRPRLLDLFCGAGGASRGYHDAGFEVVGVDISPQPNYPFEFRECDALDFLYDVVNPPGDVPSERFDAIHASPPCQAHTSLNVVWNAREHADLVGPSRDLLRLTGLPYVIENVVGAPLLAPFRLCGSSFGLGTETHELRRHRLFETNWEIGMVPPCGHSTKPVLGIYGDHARDRRRARSVEDGQFRAAEGLAMAREALGIPWANWRELSQAIPPAFTKWIGERLIQHALVEAVA